MTDGVDLKKWIWFYDMDYINFTGNVTCLLIISHLFD